MSHIPVLLHEVVEALNPTPGSFMIDGTLGDAGYAEKILEQMGGTGVFLGMDWDPEAVRRAEAKLQKFRERGIDVRIRNGNFASLPDVLREEKLGHADGLALDLGFSSDQIENSGRGFSFRKSEPLIMTYSDDVLPVKEILRELSESELADVIRKFGEERFSGRIARCIKDAMRKKKIETTNELAEIVSNAVPHSYERGRIHPATRTFQALRIYANGELDNLQHAIMRVRDIVAPRGRIAIVSFHSLEDRIVKRTFMELEKDEKLTRSPKKPIVPTREELAANPRARSAKLRIGIII
jgi:16S rRNA (cytosine1402-N4)-methyltransferase